MKKKTQIVSIDGMMITIPSYYVKVDPMPGDPDRSVPFMVRTENAECLAMILAIDEKQSMPRNREDFISGIRQYLKENQGLIEVEAGDSFLFSIIKTLKAPAGAGVQYTLTFQKFMTEGILQVQAFFDETGTTGMRDSIVYAMLTNEGAIGTPDDPMHGWTRDPYDPKLRKGALMNLSEEERFDEMFPASPLTMCRELVQCLMEEINPGGREEVKKRDAEDTKHGETHDSGETVSKEAADELPDITDIPAMVNVIVDICLGKLTPQDAADGFKKKYMKKAGVVVKEKAAGYINDFLQSSDQSRVRNLAETDFANEMISAAAGVGESIRKYFRKEINEEQLMEMLGNTGIKKIAFTGLEALEIPGKLGVKDAKAIFEMSATTMGYTAMMAAYQELAKALEDERIAHEERLRIEAACAESVILIRKYRIEMDQVVSAYLSTRYETFETAFAAMDKAIAENDIDGYIQGNAAIQEVLGYHPQFTNQEEFDELMFSDEAFKL